LNIFRYPPETDEKYDHTEFDRLFDKAMANETFSESDRDYFEKEICEDGKPELIGFSFDYAKDIFFVDSQNRFKLHFIYNYLSDRGHLHCKIEYLAQKWVDEIDLDELYDTYYKKFKINLQVSHEQAFRNYKYHLLDEFYKKHNLDTRFPKYSGDPYQVGIPNIFHDIVIQQLFYTTSKKWIEIRNNYLFYSKAVPYLNDFVDELFEEAKRITSHYKTKLTEDQLKLGQNYLSIFVFNEPDTIGSMKYGDGAFSNGLHEICLRLYLMGEDKTSYPNYYYYNFRNYTKHRNFEVLVENEKPAPVDEHAFNEYIPRRYNYPKSRKIAFDNFSLKLFKIYTHNSGKKHSSDNEKKFYLYILYFVNKHLQVFNVNNYSIENPKSSWMNWSQDRKTSSKRLEKKRPKPQ
jgi:hypothetical protein